MKREIGKPVFFLIIAVVAVAAGWFGWRLMETPENRGLDEKATFLAAERKAKSNGIDIKTVPGWTALYYKYHPEEKPATAGGGSGVTGMPVPPLSPAPPAAK